MLENEENRACDCNSNCQEQAEQTCAEKRNQRQEMLCKIQQLDFAIEELALYLDTHPNDQKALCLHREYSKKCKPLKDMYQKIYGPLNIYYPCNKWRWLEEPWPWEGGIN